MRFSTASIVLIAALGVTSPSLADEKPWREARSPHFRIITNGGERDGRHLAHAFEQMAPRGNHPRRRSWCRRAYCRRGREVGCLRRPQDGSDLGAIGPSSNFSTAAVRLRRFRHLLGGTGSLYALFSQYRCARGCPVQGGGRQVLCWRHYELGFPRRFSAGAKSCRPQSGCCSGSAQLIRQRPIPLFSLVTLVPFSVHSHGIPLPVITNQSTRFEEQILADTLILSDVHLGSEVSHARKAVRTCWTVSGGLASTSDGYRQLLCFH